MSDDLVDAIRALSAPNGARRFCAPLSAVRIAVNDELTMLETALPLLRDRLKPADASRYRVPLGRGPARQAHDARVELVCICPPGSFSGTSVAISRQAPH